MPRYSLWLALMVALLALSFSSCASNSPLAGIATPTAAVEATPEPAKPYKVGEPAQLGDQTVTVNKIEKADGIVSINLSIANSGSAEIAISSQLQFVARDSEDSRGKLLGDEEGSRSYWKLKPGDKLQDNLKFKFSPAAKGIRLFYTKVTLITTGRAEPPVIFILD